MRGSRWSRDHRLWPFAGLPREGPGDHEVWRTYLQLTDAKAAFRIQKSELSIRPVWHHREDRVQAHIFVCFLAYVIWKPLEQRQRRAGLGPSPRTVLEELAEIQSADVVLLTVDGRASSTSAASSAPAPARP